MVYDLGGVHSETLHVLVPLQLFENAADELKMYYIRRQVNQSCRWLFVHFLARCSSPSWIIALLYLDAFGYKREWIDFDG